MEYSLKPLKAYTKDLLKVIDGKEGFRTTMQNYELALKHCILDKNIPLQNKKNLLKLATAYKNGAVNTKNTGMSFRTQYKDLLNALTGQPYDNLASVVNFIANDDVSINENENLSKQLSDLQNFEKKINYCKKLTAKFAEAFRDGFKQTYDTLNKPENYDLLEQLLTTNADVETSQTIKNAGNLKSIIYQFANYYKRTSTEKTLADDLIKGALNYLNVQIKEREDAIEAQEFEAEVNEYMVFWNQRTNDPIALESLKLNAESIIASRRKKRKNG